MVNTVDSDNLVYTNLTIEAPTIGGLSFLRWSVAVTCKSLLVFNWMSYEKKLLINVHFSPPHGSQ